MLKKIDIVTFSKHFYKKSVIRGICADEIKAYLKFPSKLLIVEDQGQEHKGHKYGLLFKKSNKYDLKVIVSINDNKINVVTAHIQNIKRRKVYKKWLKKRK